jgi:hypothetical protein
MKLSTLAALLLVGLAAPAFSWDLTAGPGAVVRMSDGKSGGLFTVGCVFDQKWELRAYYFGEQRIYGGAIVIDAFPAVSVSRLWMFREGRFFRPVLGMGLMLKGADRCRYNGEINCNRILPLPFGFLPSIGAKFGDVLVTLGHASNASLDYGPEKKNLGLDHIRAEVWF